MAQSQTGPSGSKKRPAPGRVRETRAPQAGSRAKPDRLVPVTTPQLPLARVPEYLERRYRRQNWFLTVWRVGRALLDRRLPLLPTAMRVLCRVVFQADVPLEVSVPRGVIFMHNGLGLVVHTNVVFEGPAIVFHNVTIGNSLGSREGAPRVGSHVMIGAGAAIIGPVHIGDGSIIGANAVVTRDVPPGSVVTGNPATVRPCDPALVRNLFASLPPDLVAAAPRAA
jgi:serine O-acetyltransferase